MWRAIFCVIVCSAAGFTVAGCEPDDLSRAVPEEVCASQIQWTGGDHESPLMHPGKDCVACHEKRGEGPRFAFAGTVYAGLGEANDCYGESEVQIIVTDANGQEWPMSSNGAGNFYLRQSGAGGLALPYTARVISGDRAKEMVTPQMEGSCNACHTPSGNSGAPGRITVP